MKKVTLKSANLPLALCTYYQWHSRRKVNWLSRIDPEGRRGRDLWVDVDEYNEWAAPRGHQPLRFARYRSKN